MHIALLSVLVLSVVLCALLIFAKNNLCYLVRQEGQGELQPLEGGSKNNNSVADDGRRKDIIFSTKNIQSCEKLYTYICLARRIDRCEKSTKLGQESVGTVCGSPQSNQSIQERVDRGKASSFESNGGHSQRADAVGQRKRCHISNHKGEQSASKVQLTSQSLQKSYERSVLQDDQHKFSLSNIQKHINSVPKNNMPHIVWSNDSNAKKSSEDIYNPNYTQIKLRRVVALANVHGLIGEDKRDTVKRINSVNINFANKKAILSIDQPRFDYASRQIRYKDVSVPMSNFDDIGKSSYSQVLRTKSNVYGTTSDGSRIYRYHIKK